MTVTPAAKLGDEGNEGGSAAGGGKPKPTPKCGAGGAAIGKQVDAPAAKKTKKTEAVGGQAGRSNFKGHLINASKTKKVYHEAVASAASLRGNIVTSDAWAWATGRTNFFDVCLVDLQSSMRQFSQSFTCVDQRQMKQHYDMHAMSLGVQQVPKLESKIKAVEQVIIKLNSLHAVELSYEKGH